LHFAIQGNTYVCNCDDGSSVACADGTCSDDDGTSTSGSSDDDSTDDDGSEPVSTSADGANTATSADGSKITCPQGVPITCSGDKCKCLDGSSGSGGSSTSDEADDSDDSDGSTVVTNTDESGSTTSGGAGATFKPVLMIGTSLAAFALAF